MSALAVSQVQKHFITNEIYKRSRRYFDVIKLKSIESLDSKFRRVPSTVQRQEIEKKMENSFMSSQEYFSKKRLDQIEKSKKKHCSFQTVDDHDETETNYSVVTKHQATSNKKCFDMSKSLPRDFYENLQNHAFSSVQDPFDSFVSSDFSKGEKGKSIDFNKILGRRDFSGNSTNISKLKIPEGQPNPETIKTPHIKIEQKSKIQDIGKVYEKFYFDQSKFKCLIDVQKQRKAEQRRSLRTNLKEYETKEISLQKIEKGRIASHKQPTPSCLMFYHGKGKQEASSLHYRMLKKNENYWVEQIKSMRREDFETVKRRKEMIEKRLKEITDQRKVTDSRGEICDAKYFLRSKHK